MPDQNYSEPSLLNDTDHELLFKAAYALWLTEQGGGGGSGTVTSVGLSLPSIFSVSDSPVTTAGTLTGDLVAQAANTVFAGPTGGAAAAPTFRALASTDIAAAGSNTWVQYNVGGVLGASEGFTFFDGGLALGAIGVSTGLIHLVSDGGGAPNIQIDNPSGGSVVLIDDAASASARTATFPDATGILVLNDNTASLTNKTINGSSNTITNVSLTTGVTGDLPLANLAQASAASRLLGRGSAAGAGDYQEITLGTGLSMSGTALSVSGFATLGANTFTALQTITQASANAGIIASTGYSLTGANATNMVDLAGTWNTSGAPTAFKINITDTASSSGSLLLDLQRSSNSVFNIRRDGQFLSTGSGRCTAITVDGSGGFFNFSGRTVLESRADGSLLMENNANTDFGLLQFGGVTSSFPALKRSTTTIQVRLADDSNYAGINAASYAVAGTAGATGGTFTSITSITVVNGIVTAISGT